ncbi:MAG: hypothetical protein KJN63_12470 [Acidimicrobiia bacterium]|nr:hypothetical protein [Acidimicrobiia bacterium]
MAKQNRNSGGKDKRRPSASQSKNSSRSGKGRGSRDRRSDGATSSKGRRRDELKPPSRAERSGWGSVAQHGAAGATHGQRLDEAAGPHEFSADEQRRYAERQARRAKSADRIEGLRSEARAAIDRSEKAAPTATAASTAPTVARRPLPGRPAPIADVRKELLRFGGPERGARAYKLYLRAAREFENEQFDDAYRTLRPLVEEYSDVVELIELYGLTLYRLGNWEHAIDQLEDFRAKSGTAEQHPPLMDAHRALGHWADVDVLWKELGETSPNAELVTEGRIVRAGADADQGELDQAIRLLEKGWKAPKHPREHHLRRAYALADLYERAGRLPRSRSLFAWIAGVSPGYLDVDQRLRALG